MLLSNKNPTIAAINSFKVRAFLFAGSLSLLWCAVDCCLNKTRCYQKNVTFTICWHFSDRISQHIKKKEVIFPFHLWPKTLYKHTHSQAVSSAVLGSGPWRTGCAMRYLWLLIAWEHDNSHGCTLPCRVTCSCGLLMPPVPRWHL